MHFKPFPIGVLAASALLAAAVPSEARCCAHHAETGAMACCSHNHPVDAIEILLSMGKATTADKTDAVTILLSMGPVTPADELEAPALPPR